VALGASPAAFVAHNLIRRLERMVREAADRAHGRTAAASAPPAAPAVAITPAEGLAALVRSLSQPRADVAADATPAAAHPHDTPAAGDVSLRGSWDGVLEGLAELADESELAQSTMREYVSHGGRLSWGGGGEGGG
jgi:hypothetical protein